MRMESKIILIVTFFIASWQVHGWNDNDYFNNNYNRWHNQILSNDSISELKRLGEEIRHVVNISTNKTNYPCDSYYDYICGEHILINSVLGSMPRINDLVIILNALKYDDRSFDSKQKLINFFNSCSKVKSVDDCHVESFENFRPLYGYIISRKFLSQADVSPLIDVLESFIKRAKLEGYFSNHQNLGKLANLANNLRKPANLFSTTTLDNIYTKLQIFPSSYNHNIKNLEKYNRLYKNQSAFENYWKSALDFTIYLYQSRNKPRSYFYPTLNAHLWMTLFNNTVRYHEGRTYKDLADCFKLPSHLNNLEEARNLAVIYYKSFKFAWEEYQEWFNNGFSVVYGARATDIYDRENQILERYHLSNKHLFFIFYAQNFCFFGKDMAENIFYQGLKQSIDFNTIYLCSVGHTMNPTVKC
ncbi:hypothetical protein ACFFRR_006740 [Megaselia abdita]